ncbi:MAG: hypothetical protein IJV66_02005 [Firmicutes bacterium]|nr:hypothetical protein [Bacillota bacterium]
MTEKTKIKIGIYALAILMMGVIGVSGALTVIAEQFPGASQSQVQSIISFPCIAIIPATLITGKLMDIFPKKTIGIMGACHIGLVHRRQLRCCMQIFKIPNDSFGIL